MLLRLEMPNFDSQKTIVTQMVIKIALSGQYAYKLHQKCNRLRASLANEIFDYSIYSEKRKEISLQSLMFHKQSLISWGTKHLMSGHCFLGDQTS